MKIFMYLLCLFCLSACGSSSTSVGNGSYSVSGKVKSADNSALAGATVTFTGTSSGTATTASDGAYSFTGVNKGVYQVTAAKAGYVVTPAALSLTVTNANVTGKDFSATPASYTISGTITSGGVALSGATVALSGAGTATTTTDTSGNYSFSASNGSYTVTPTKTTYIFTPASRSATVSNADVTGKSFTAAYSGTGGGGTVGPAALGAWTWISGDSNVNRSGAYGTKGVVAPANNPGARGGAMSWTDNSGNLWLFGGSGIDATGVTGYLNDLWKFDGTNWTWISGGSLANRSGVYGTKGVPAALNEPSARDCGSTWSDGYGNLWLFGGIGLDRNGVNGYLDDLWKFDGTRWTWISGDGTANSIAVYGTKGVSSPTNKPGGREAAVSWIDQSNRLWLFGGSGKDAAGAQGHLNEIWQFDGTNWIWVSGTTIANDGPNYGTIGIPSPTNRPWARDITKSWVDPDGNLWLFGGCSNNGYLSDLWKFDGTNWTWVSGNNTFNTLGVYSITGIPSATASPGGRAGAIFWMDSNGSLWIQGGYGTDGGYNGEMNDLWKFDGTNWTVIAGNGTSNQTPVYGTKGIASALNTPARVFGSASWVKGGKVWAFGGYVPGGMTNVLWKYEP